MLTVQYWCTRWDRTRYKGVGGPSPPPVLVQDVRVTSEGGSTPFQSDKQPRSYRVYPSYRGVTPSPRRGSPGSCHRCDGRVWSLRSVVDDGGPKSRVKGPGETREWEVKRGSLSKQSTKSFDDTRTFRKVRLRKINHNTEETLLVKGPEFLGDY